MERIRYTAAGAALHELLGATGLAQARSSFGLSTARLEVLEALARFGPQTVSELARRRRGPRQAVQRLADELARSGLAAFSPNPRHRRARLLDLTAAGRQALESAAVRRAEWENRCAEGLDPGELRAAARLLQQVRVRMDVPSR